MTRYLYYNANPDGSRINDCVSRAIVLATGLSYTTVNRLLSITASYLECDKLCVCCYKHLLSHFFGYKKYTCKSGIHVKDVAREFENEILIVRIPGHLTCVKYGKVMDTWDCSDREVDCFWIVS